MRAMDGAVRVSLGCSVFARESKFLGAGAAGIQADLAAFGALGCHGLQVTTPESSARMEINLEAEHTRTRKHRSSHVF